MYFIEALFFDTNINTVGPQHTITSTNNLLTHDEIIGTQLSEIKYTDIPPN